MRTRQLGADEMIGAPRGAPVVLVLADSDLRVRNGQDGIRSAAQGLPPDVPFLIASAVADGVDFASLSGGPAEAILLALGAAAAGGGPAIAAALAAAPEADLVLVSAGALVPGDWLERLSQAVRSDNTVASATALMAEDAGLRPGSGRGERSPSRIDASGVGPPLHPRIACAGARCAYLTRGGIELASLQGWSPAEAVTADAALRAFSRAATAGGLVHVLVDDVVVASVGSGGHGDARRDAPGSFDAAESVGAVDGETGPADQPDAAQEAALLIEREDDGTPVRHALLRARVVREGLTVTLDGRALGPSVGGTQRYILELALALARTDRVGVRIVVPHDIPPGARRALEADDRIALLDYSQAAAGGEVPSHVAHRPQQLFDPTDMKLLRLLGTRIVVTHQDLIAYRNPHYHPSPEGWRHFRRTTRVVLAVADHVVFFSEHALGDALVEELVEPGRASVVGLGAQAPAPRAPAEQQAPPEIEDGEPFLLCLGADYRHKNRLFAIELRARLAADHGWSGRLVLAGPRVRWGSSRELEERLLAADEGNARSIVDLGAVTDGVRDWLLAHTRAVVYPTTYEGFGLLPLEAAETGVPCLFAPVTSLREIADDCATLVPWNAALSAAAVAPLLSDGPARDAHVAGLRTAAGRRSWPQEAARMVDVYEAAVRDPATSGTPRLWQELDHESSYAALQREWLHVRDVAEEYQEAERRLSAELARLGGDPGALIDFAENAGLLSAAQTQGMRRIAARPWLRQAVLRPLGALGKGAPGGAPGGGGG